MVRMPSVQSGALELTPSALSTHVPVALDDTALELGRSVPVYRYLNALSKGLQHCQAPPHQLPGAA